MADISIPDVRVETAKDKFTVFELSDLDALYGDSSVCARLFAKVDDGILSLTDFLLL